MYIIKHSVTQQVMEYIKARIADGSWKLHDKIPSENELTLALGVSRTSIRQAIRQFIALGVLESKHGKGTFLVNHDLNPFANAGNGVSTDDCGDVVKVVEFRLIVEPEASFLAARHARPGDLTKLREHVAGLRETLGDREEYMEHDMAFHAEIARLSNNPLLEKSIKAVFRQARQGFRKMFALFKFKGGGMYYHPLILQAIEEGNARQARRVMREHVQSNLDQLAECMESE